METLLTGIFGSLFDHGTRKMYAAGARAMDAQTFAQLCAVARETDISFDDVVKQFNSFCKAGSNGIFG